MEDDYSLVRILHCFANQILQIGGHNTCYVLTVSINPFTATAAIAHFEKESLPEPNAPVNTLAELLRERESQDQGTRTAIQSIFKVRKSRES